MSDLSSDSFDPAARHSALDGLDHLSGLLALLLTAMIGLDLYSWIAHNRQPRGSILWLLPTGASLWRRAIVGKEDGRRWPKRWDLGFGLYFTMVLGITLIKGPAGAEQWMMVSFTLVFIAISFWQFSRR